MTGAAIYCRVSTEDQGKEGTSLQTQLEACEGYCIHNGYDVSHRFAEAYSGLTLDRPKLTELRDLLRSGEITVVVIYCLDRISRDPTHGVILTQEFERLNVALESVTEDITNSELGKLISYIRGFASKLEAEKIRERTMRGKQARLKEGKLPQGTGIGIYGYRWDPPTGKRQIIDHEAQTVRQIFSMAMLGTSTNQIAISLNKDRIPSKSGSLWYPLTVRRLLRNQAYAGKTYFGQTKRINGRAVKQPREDWHLLPDVTPPVITEEIFEKAHAAMRDAKQARPVNPNAHYLLTGFMRCTKCGSPIGGTTMQGKYRYYHCRGARPTATRGKICDARYIKADRLEADLWRRVIVMMTSPHTILRAITDKSHQQPNNILSLLARQIDQLRKKLKTYSSKEKNLYDLMSHDAVTSDYVLESVEKLKQERTDDQQQLRSLVEQRKGASRSQNLSLQLSEFSEQKMIDLLFEHAYRDHDVIWPEEKDEAPVQVPVSVSELHAKRRLLLQSIGLRVLADPESFSFTFTLQGNLISSAQEEDLSSFQKQLREFEDKHADVTVGDLLDPKQPLAEDSRFPHAITELKDDLVTIERTWGCLSSDAYSWAIPFSYAVKL